MKIADAKRSAGRVIIAGFDGLSLPTDLARAAEEDSLGGIILFSRNVEDVDQVAALTAEVRARAGDGGRQVIGIDQEGGRVVRIREPLTVLPPARVLGSCGDRELTRAAGRLVGRELCALGFTVDFAPVLDVDSNPESPLIGDRAYGSTVEVVIEHGLAFGEGLLQGGVHPCAKHFPGHGDATLDSHVALPRVEHGRERLHSVELAPFTAWARAGIGAIMSAHVVYPALDPAGPATVSQTVLTGELRERLGFDGAVLTDDLEMGAIGDIGGAAVVAVAALRAGADGLLVCRSREIHAAVVEALAAAAVADRALADRLEQSARRLARLSIAPVAPVDRSWIGAEEHLALRAEILSGLGRQEAP